MEVRAKKGLGQHFLTDQGIAMNIVGALKGSPVLEVGPGMGVLTQYLLERVPANNSTPLHPQGGLRGVPLRLPESQGSEADFAPNNPTPLQPESQGSEASQSDGAAGGETTATLGTLRGGTVSEANGGAERSEAVEPLQAPSESREVSEPLLKAVEIDKESVEYLKKHFPELGDGLIEGDFLKMDLASVFPGEYSVIGNFPYNISSQIFFKILDHKDIIPEVVCMIQKEVAERIAEKPGTKTYGILSVFLQAWYDIEYLFTVGSGAFNPPPKVQSAVIRLTRNSRTTLGCDEKLFRTVVKTAFGQRRKTLRNSLKPLVAGRRSFVGLQPPQDDICPKELIDNHTEADPSRHSEAGHENVTLSEAKGLEGQTSEVALTDPIFELRPERLSVEDFIRLTLLLQK